MHRTKPDPDEARCACGRAVSAAQSFSYSSNSTRYLFQRCMCGKEWTRRELAVDRSEPVSPDEILDVHERLAAFQGSLTELLGFSRAP
jgi:hypothetical protein